MSASRLHFKVDAQTADSKARATTFQTMHGVVRSPLFMPVGTQAAVKAQQPGSLEIAGSQILLANTYHLLLRPGPEVFRKLGGYHGFTSWQGSVLTDSGGFQIFSLSDSLTMSEQGAAFRSPINGDNILLSPELSIDMQKAIGSDIMMVLDQCIPSTASMARAESALDLTHRWAVRSLAARQESEQSLFAIVQGALFPELRRRSAQELAAMPFDGYAIGGLAVGEDKNQREDICQLTASLLPASKPRYLMGVGTPLDILEAVHRGVDMFDCIIPTQVAQHGTVFSSRGVLKLRRTVYKFSDDPLDLACECATCKRFSRAYLHHLLKAKEPLAWQLLGQHNIFFYHQLMREIRQSILNDRFVELYKRRRALLHENDIDNPPSAFTAKKPQPKILGAYEVHRQEGGFSSIRHCESGEIMHSRTSPIEEAHKVYVDQSDLAIRLRMQGHENRPLVVWDVGLGAAANAMAAVACYEQLAAIGTPLNDLHIISFENDLDSLRLAMRHNGEFEYLRHPAPASILQKGAWISTRTPGLRWTLLFGDFQTKQLECLARPPDLIYFDMFSSKTHQSAWTLESFERLFGTCAGHAAQVFTYSCSTAIRASLLVAGFYVAAGVGTGPKTATTVALTPAAIAENSMRHQLLDSVWLATWRRSSAQFPRDLPHSEHGAFAQNLLQHHQFRGH